MTTQPRIGQAGTPEWRPWLPATEPGAAARESCTMQALLSGAVGGGAGLVLGVVLAPFNSSMGAETENLPMKEQFRRGFREMGSQSRSWGKNFMVIGAVFSCSECFVEKTRGRSDSWNPVLGGCVTGSALAVGGEYLSSLRSNCTSVPHPALGT